MRSENVVRDVDTWNLGLFTEPLVKTETRIELFRHAILTSERLPGMGDHATRIATLDRHLHRQSNRRAMLYVANMLLTIGSAHMPECLARDSRFRDAVQG